MHYALIPIASRLPWSLCVLAQSIFGATLLFFAAQSTFGQGTIFVSLDKLPPNQPLREQFAAEGIHFLPETGAPPITLTAPSALGSAGETVGRASSLSIQFDYPVFSIVMSVASEASGIGGRPNVTFYGYLPGGGTTVGNGFTLEPNHWTDAGISFSPGLTRVGVSGGLTGLGENLPYPIYFRSIQVTTVPEPSSWVILCTGFCGLLLWRRAR